MHLPRRLFLRGRGRRPGHPGLRACLHPYDIPEPLLISRRSLPPAFFDLRSSDAPRRTADTPQDGQPRFPFHPPARAARRLRPARHRYVPAGLPADRAGPQGPGRGDAVDALALPGRTGGRATHLRADLRPRRTPPAAALRLGRLRDRLRGLRLRPFHRSPDPRPVRHGPGRGHRNGRRAGRCPRLLRGGGFGADLLDAHARHRHRADHLAIRGRLADGPRGLGVDLLGARRIRLPLRRGGRPGPAGDAPGRTADTGFRRRSSPAAMPG